MNVHKFFLLSIFVITVFGLIMIASASSFQAQREFNSPFYLFFKQFGQGFLFGIGGFLLTYAIPVAKVKKFIVPCYLLAIFLLILVFIPHIGLIYGGSHRWIQLAGFTFQPSEFAKVALIFYVASWLGSHRKGLPHFSATFLPGFCMSMVIPLLILAEPNVSNFSITTFIVLIMFFMAGTRISHMASVLLCILIIGIVALVFLPTRLSRIQTLLNPKEDLRGTGYQLNQSLIAIESGGLWGKGLGMSDQKYSALPEVSGDAIFAIIAEELGFIGALFVIVLYFSIFIEGLFIMRQSRDPFSRYVVIGFVSLILLQGLIHISAVSGFLPLTGVTLPFISYGSSSLASLLAASGFVAQIAKKGTQG